MSKAFVREDQDDDDEALPAAPDIPTGAPNYITPSGYARLKHELDRLLNIERPEVVKTVSWAASNGDRSENGDYIYGKKRLREIDRRIRFLIKRMEYAQVVDPAAREQTDAVFFGATVTVADASDVERTYSIVGLDEVDLARGHVSWISPIAKALLKAREGDVVTLRSPSGIEELEITRVEYKAL